ncbi:uncharacterized protein LOC109863824 [Pseudomyrmex gracilis]|uniref:uncharacterized protein LOC109863824 n=1 Tax=Pseudomyrmex gracilis TaxID=219809 RepID=UPI000995A0F7|nr:uncharacterized protein LOC109863824 [Pseudomyrmex gracilis]
MPQIMAEAFARGLLDKIMIQVLDVIDRDAQEEESWEPRVDEETSNVQSEFVNGTLQARTQRNYSKAEEMELIAKIVRDLRDMQIGDSRYVLPPSLLGLEKQVKYATCNIESVTLTNPTVDVVETQPAIQGQGDTQQQIVHTSSAKPKTDQKEKQDDAPVEATSVSAGLLHQLIEELEDNAVPVRAKDSSPNTTSKEHVAIWEEKEEELIKTIEDNANEISTKTFRESGSIGHFRATELKHDDELRSRSTQHLRTTSKETGLEEIQLKKHELSSLSLLKTLDATMTVEQILPASDTEKRKLDEATTTKKKKGFGSRLRRFFRAAFGRRKN